MGHQSLKFSVVMATLNQGHFIKAAIESVRCQDYGSVELIVMDGGSTDGTIDILKSFGNEIAYISQKDKGQSDAINQGLEAASGDILCWLNSDDLLERGAFSTVAAAFKDHPDVDFIYGNGYNVNEQNDIIGPSGVKPFNRWKLIHHRNFIQQPSCFFRRSLFKKVGPLRNDLHYVMDWELWIRFALYRGMFLDRYLSRNRTYSKNKTFSGRFRRWLEIRKMLGKYTNRRVTPAIILYFAEALLQTLQTRHIVNAVIGFPLRLVFFWGMEHEFSGFFADGSVSKRFRFTVPNPDGKSRVALRIRLADAFKKRLRENDCPLLKIFWKNSVGKKGGLGLSPKDGLQEFRLPLENNGNGGFVHFCCTLSSESLKFESTTNYRHPKPVAFLEKILPV